MKNRQVDQAFALAEQWINGNRKDVITALETERPLVAAAMALQITRCLSDDDVVHFTNAVDRAAGEHE